MRSGSDRVRHAIGFEVVGLLLCIPLFSWATGMDAKHMGLIGVSISVLATGWNYVYNVLVDRLMFKFLGRLEKNYIERIGHAIGFELGLLLITLPAIAYAMSITVVEALFLDIGLVIFYVVYAFFYNLVYDKLFPAPFAPQQVNA